MRQLVPSVSLEQQLILFYRVNGECTEISLICDKAEEDDVYTLTCKYATKKKKVFLNSTSNCKEFTKPQYLQKLDEFLISTYFSSRMGSSNSQCPEFGRNLCIKANVWHIIP